MSKKQVLILIVLLAVLAGAVLFYRSQAGFWPWQKKSAVEISASVTPQQKTVRDKIMGDLAQRIGEISPAQPVLGGQWFIDRFWFVAGSDYDFYVEYEDGHIMTRLLLEARKKDDSFDYSMVAYFEPGESDWALKSGQDRQFGKALDLYEYNEAEGKWVKEN